MMSRNDETPGSRTPPVMRRFSTMTNNDNSAPPSTMVFVRRYEESNAELRRLQSRQEVKNSSVKKDLSNIIQQTAMKQKVVNNFQEVKIKRFFWYN